MEKRIEILNTIRGCGSKRTKKILYDMYSPLVNKDYVKMSYMKMKRVLFTELCDERGLYGGNVVDTNTMNCEHVWPQSFFKGKYPMKSDLNHCFLTNSRLNSHRNSYRFFDVEDGEYMDENGKKLVKGGTISNKCSRKCNYERTFEPRDISKGNIARAVAYFNTMYPEYDMSKIIDVDTMLRWHKEDPVDECEQFRTDVIFKYQRNLNPYIVCPELMEIVYSDEIRPPTVMESIALLEKQLDKLDSILCNLYI